ncbi:uncharacterized protein LOC121390219 [Gigantopelta aegis]|uniref:uncharacterized protein LOC121390219 n=1 Tax=Gigantopelta aegis TaxID=1735272 RepID=UPI001B88B3E0|nr:uncharacterized protein LOC121390219 [Gigantopelta aegis]
MSNIDHKSVDELCSNVKKILDCIKPNIVRKCGSKAAKLVEVLVKPMIKGSTQCDYNIVKTKTTKTPSESTLKNRNVITVDGNGSTSPVTSQKLGLRAVCLFIIVILVSFR